MDALNMAYQQLTGEIAAKDAKIEDLQVEKRKADDDRTRASLKEDIAELQRDKRDLLDRRSKLEERLAAAAATQPGTWRPMHIDDFKRLCGVEDLTTKETLELFHLRDARAAMETGSMTAPMAKFYLTQIRGRVRTTTKLAIKLNEGMILDGDIAGQGQTSSALHFAFWEAHVVCAKVYRTADIMAARIEEVVSRAVHAAFACPTLIQVKRLIETDRHGFLMLPLLGRACSDLLRFRPVGHDLDDYAGIICISTLSAIAGLAMLGWCHGDVKPANIMLPTHKGGCATLIDLASCKRYGEALTEITPAFAMGLQPRQASLKWDLVCTAATLQAIDGSTPAESWEQLLGDLGEGGAQGESLSRMLCRIILRNVDANVEQLQTCVWQPCLELVEAQQGPEVAGPLRDTWPRMHAGTD